MLSTPEGQSKQLILAEVGAPDAARVSSAAGATHQDFDPQLDTPFSQDSFQSGLGQVSFDNFDEQAIWWGSGVVTHVDGKAYLAPPVSNLSMTSATGAINGFYSYTTPNGARYDFCWSGTRIYRRDAANKTNAWSVCYTHASQTVTDFKIFNGAGIIAVAGDTSTTDFWNVTANLLSGTFTTSGANHTPFSSGNKPKYWCPVRGTLYALVDNAKVYYTVDPTTDGWLGPISVTVSSTGANVGDASYAFTNVIAMGDYLFPLKADAGYNIDSEQIVTEVFAQWKDKPSMTNFRFVSGSPLGLLFGVANEVYLYNLQSGVTAPLDFARQPGFGVKEILGIGADNQYVYVLATVRVPTLRSADSCALFRGYRLRGAKWAFECLWEDTSVTETYYNLAAVPFGIGTRLYWGQTASGATTTNVMDIPAEWDETASGSFATSGTMYTSIARASFPGFVKRHLWFSMETDNTSSSSLKVAVAYSTDNGATFTSLGDTGSGSSSTLISQFSYSNVASRSVALRFTFTGTGSATPILRVFDHHQRVRFKYLPAGQVTVRIGDNIELNNGISSKVLKETLVANLTTLRTTNSTVTYEDFLGNSFPVTVDQISLRPTRHYIPNTKTNVYEEEATIFFSRADSGA